MELYDYAEWDVRRTQDDNDPVCDACWEPATTEHADGTPLCEYCAQDAKDRARGWVP
jgi:predicted amidophosphoribosyltransferase